MVRIITNPHCTRRDMLAAFLGLPMALAGCSSRATPDLPEGDLLGTNHRIGHRIRDGFQPAVPEQHWQRTNIVIVGGGIAGLSAAWRLAKANVRDFVVLELEDVAGGTTRSGRSPVVAYPWGAHYVPVPMRENRLLIHLLDEMAILAGRDGDGNPIAAEQFLCRDPEERVFYRGHWYEGLYLHAGASAEDRRQFDVFQREINQWVAWRDGSSRRAFALPLAHCSTDAEVTALDRISMAQWLDERRLTSPRLRWFINYACRDDYGTTLDNTSAWAALFYYAARRRVPGAESQPVMTWPEGNGRFVAHFLNTVRPRLRLGYAVTSIRPTQPTGVEVVAFHPGQRQAVGYRADQVIFAAPQLLTPYIIAPFRDRAPPHVEAFTYGSWMVANLHLSDRPAGLGFPPAWDNVLYESPSLGYVSATHQALRDHGPTVLTYYYPLCEENPDQARRTLIYMSRDDWADVTLTDLTRAHPNIRTLTQRLDVMRWGHAMVQARPGFIWSAARQAADRPYRNIHFAHTDLSGIPLFEEALYHGVRAAEEILTARGVAFTSLL